MVSVIDFSSGVGVASPSGVAEGSVSPEFSASGVGVGVLAGSLISVYSSLS